MPERVIACGKWRSRQASFVVLILFTAIHICRPMYSLGGSAEIRIDCIHTLSLLKVEPLNKWFDFMSANVNSQVFRNVNHPSILYGFVVRTYPFAVQNRMFVVLQTTHFKIYKVYELYWKPVLTKYSRTPIVGHIRPWYKQLLRLTDLLHWIFPFAINS